MSAWSDLKSSCYRYFPGGLTIFLVSKRLCKIIKHDFEGSFSNFDIGLFTGEAVSAVIVQVLAHTSVAEFHSRKH